MRRIGTTGKSTITPNSTLPAGVANGFPTKDFTDITIVAALEPARHALLGRGALALLFVRRRAERRD